MQRLSRWTLVRLAALPRVAPVLLFVAWFVAAAQPSERPWVGVIVGCLASASLLVADRWPQVPLVAFVVGLPVADTFGGVARDDPWITLLVCAMFCLGRFGRGWHQALAGGACLLLVAMNLLDRGLAVTVGDVAFPLLFTLGPWAVGLALKTAVRQARDAVDHAAAVVESSAASVQRATAEERLRIARDLHDVVAHNISAVSLQAQTARRLAEAGHPVDPADLRAMEEVAQATMTDLRHLLGVLRPERGIEVTGPHEGLAQVDDLVRMAARVGQQVDLDVEGTPRDLPPALSLVAYRILQESIANARRHAPRANVRVMLSWSPGALALEVRNRAPAAVAEPGNGTAGMAERAALFGGELQAGPSDHDWVVRCRLPTPALSREAG